MEEARTYIANEKKMQRMNNWGRLNQIANCQRETVQF